MATRFYRNIIEVIDERQWGRFLRYLLENTEEWHKAAAKMVANAGTIHVDMEIKESAFRYVMYGKN